MEEEKGEIRTNFLLDMAGLPGKFLGYLESCQVQPVIFLVFINVFWRDAELYVQVLNLFT